MHIHHLNCGTLCPGAKRWVDGEGSLFDAGRRICHCLLIESREGLVLVEAGIGLEDIAHASARLGPLFRYAARPRLDPDETAAQQVQRLGFKRSDVRHIVLTHAHLDHVGGVADFPHATVHLYADEHLALTQPTRREMRTYNRLQWAHEPRWALHKLEGERFFGFEAVRPLPGLSPDILLVPLPGHTRGHAGVAVRGPRGFLFHAGDTYFHRDQLDESRSKAPPALRLFQRLVDFDSATREHNLSRLRELKAQHSAEVEIFCAHDPLEFDAQVKKARVPLSLSTASDLTATS